MHTRKQKGDQGNEYTMETFDTCVQGRIWSNQIDELHK